MSAAKIRSGPRDGVLFFGGYDPEYPRNVILRKGLARCGLAVGECRADGRRKVHLRYPALIARFLGRRGAGRVMFVPEFRHKDVPLAWALARCTRRSLVFDPLVSRYETRVLDRGDAEHGSAQARHNRNIDRMSMRLPDIVLADTSVHADFYAREFSIPAGKLRCIPVGFDDDVFSEAPPSVPGPVTSVLFYGSFLPLHGVETIIAAARFLSHAAVRFVLVGEGQTRRDAERISAGLPEGRVMFRPRVPERELPR
jgi:glycosyltransferase involved in cell wall biosynthesis